MVIALDDSPLKTGHSIRGVGTYTRSLYSALTRYVPELSVTWMSKSTSYDVIHYPYFDLFFATLPFIKQKPTIVTIHDVIPLLYPIDYRPGIKGTLSYWHQVASLRSVNAIITDSECSKRDIANYLSLKADTIFVVPLAPAEHLIPATPSMIETELNRLNIKKPYFLYVGDINFNKNLPALIRAVAPHRETLSLVMVSPAMNGPSKEAHDLNHLIGSLNLTESIHIVTDIPSDDTTSLRALYSGASWYIQPSLYEGFGLPPIEAMRCKTAVISSTGGSLKEVVGNHAVTFDPLDPQGITKALSTALSMKTSHKLELISNAYQWAKQYSWKITATETAKIYTNI